MHALNMDMNRAVHRAAELTEELARLMDFLRGAADGAPPVVAAASSATPAPSAIDVEVLARLVDDMGDPDMVVDLVAAYANGLEARVERLLAGASQPEAEQRRLLIDLRSASELLGAVSVAEWCRSRQQGDEPTDSTLRELVPATRRACNEWRLKMLDHTES